MEPVLPRMAMRLGGVVGVTWKWDGARSSGFTTDAFTAERAETAEKNRERRVLPRSLRPLRWAPRLAPTAGCPPRPIPIGPLRSALGGRSSQPVIDRHA